MTLQHVVTHKQQQSDNLWYNVTFEKGPIQGWVSIEGQLWDLISIWWKRNTFINKNTFICGACIQTDTAVDAIKTIKICQLRKRKAYSKFTPQRWLFLTALAEQQYRAYGPCNVQYAFLCSFSGAVDRTCCRGGELRMFQSEEQRCDRFYGSLPNSFGGDSKDFLPLWPSLVTVVIVSLSALLWK